MPASIRSVSRGHGNPSATVPAPTGVASGDLLLAFVQGDSATITITGVPTGYTLITDTVSDGGSTMTVYQKVAGAAEGETTWTVSADDVLVHIVCVQDADTATAVQQVTATHAAATSYTLPGITPSADSLLLAWIAVDGSAPVGAMDISWSSAEGYVEAFDYSEHSGITTARNMWFGGATQQGSSGTAVAGPTATFTNGSGAETGISGAFGVAHASAGPGTVQAAATLSSGSSLTASATGGTDAVTYPTTFRGYSPETASNLGPFLDSNGALYTLAETGLSTDTNYTQPGGGQNQPMLWRTTNAGSTWAEVAADQRVAATGDMEGSWAIQHGTQIHLAFCDSQGDVKYRVWNTSDAPTNPDTLVTAQDDIYASTMTAQQNSLAAFTNGDLILPYAHTSGARYAKRTGTTWQAAAEVPILDAAATRQVSAVRGANDIIHLCYVTGTNQIQHKTLTSGGTLSAAQRVDTNGTPTEAQCFGPITNPMTYHDEAGAEVITVTFVNGSGHLRAVRIVNGTPGAEQTINSAVVYGSLDPPGGGQASAITHQAVDPDTDTVHVIWVDSTDLDVYWSNSVAGGAWSAPTKIVDAVSARWASSLLVYTRPSGMRALSFVIEDDPSDVQIDTQSYYEYELGKATATVTGAATLSAGSTLTAGALVIRQAAAALESGSSLTSTGGATTPVSYLRGVNHAGGEFSETTGTGTYDVDWHYDKQETFDYVAGRGHKLVRLPFRWERVQPTRGAALDATLLGHLTDAVARVGTAGMSVILDMHNYCRRYEGGVEHVLGDTITEGELADVWSRLSAAFASNSTVVGYGIQNEPHTLPKGSTLTGAELVPNGGFETDLSGWVADGSTIARSTTVSRSGVASMQVTSSGAADAKAFTSPNLTVTGGATYALGYPVRGTASSAGLNSFVAIDWFDGGGAYLSSDFLDYFPLVDGQWQQHLVQVTAPATAAAGKVIVGFQATAAGQVLYADDVTLAAGTVHGGAQLWESASQACVDAIRVNDTATTIYVGGYDYSPAARWTSQHPEPWITDSANKTVYEAHYYFDRDNSGKYVNTFADEDADAVSRGYTSLTDRATSEITNFTDWLTAKGVKGFIGEIGWPNTGDTVSWNAVGEAVYDALDAAGLPATYWAAGEWWGDTYILQVYKGDPHSLTTSISATVEAHPSVTSAATVLQGAATLAAATSLAAGAQRVVVAAATLAAQSSLAAGAARQALASAALAASTGLSVVGRVVRQYLRPSATADAAGWTATGAPTLHEALDEDPPSTADYISTTVA